jgi:hypothetical protein
MRPLINFIAIINGWPIFFKAVNYQGEVKIKFFMSTIIKEVMKKIDIVCKAIEMLIEIQYSKFF